MRPADCSDGALCRKGELAQGVIQGFRNDRQQSARTIERKRLLIFDEIPQSIGKQNRADTCSR